MLWYVPPSYYSVCLGYLSWKGKVVADYRFHCKYIYVQLTIHILNLKIIWTTFITISCFVHFVVSVNLGMRI